MSRILPTRVLATVVTIALAVGALFATAPPAQAGLYGPVPADASGEPNDLFTEEQALFAYVRSDIAGGRICVVGGDATADTGSCDSPAFGRATQLIGIGTMYVLIWGHGMPAGRYALLVENSLGQGTEVSGAFDVFRCDECAKSPDAAIVEEFKASARAMGDSMGGMCSLQGLLENVAGDAIKLRGINQEISIIMRGSVTVSSPSFSMTVSGSAQLASFTIQDPLTVNINKALGILKHVSCGSERMYRDLAADPPDPDFGTVFAPDFADIGPLEPAPLDELTRSSDRQRALSEAALRAFERYQGAVAADDVAGQKLQARAAGEMATQLGVELENGGDSMDAWAAAAAADEELAGVVMTTAEAPDLTTLYARVRDTGFNADEIGQFRSFGYTDAEIDAIRTHASVDLGKVPLDQTYPSVLETYADTWRDQADSVSRFGVEMLAVAARLDEPPIAAFTVTPVDEDTFRFTSTTSSPDGDALASLDWDFGDGATGTGAVVQHTFAASGVYSVTLQACDAFDCASATEPVSVSGGNNSPAAVDDTLVTEFDTPGGVHVLSNDSDPDGDPLTVSAFDAATTAGGAASCDTDGSCSYTPPSGFSGADSFGYTASDSKGAVAQATVSITVRSAVNSNPIVADDVLATVAGTPGSVDVLSNDSDPDADVLTVTGSTQPAHGLVTCPLNGQCTYTPAAGFTGTDSFTYNAADGRGGTATASVAVTVEPATPGNQAPVAEDDQLDATVDSDAIVFVLANDSDADNDGLTVASVSDPAHGTAICQFGMCTYRSDLGYTGPDSFEYVVADGRGGTDVGAVAVTVKPNAPPVATDDELTTRQDAPSTRNTLVLENDVDPEGDTLSITDHTDPPHGVAACFGTFCSYIPDPGHIGTDSFDYTLSDGHNTDTATVLVTITENHAPVADVDILSTVVDDVVVFGPLGNDIDEDQDALTVTDHTQPVHGEANCDATLCTYTPDAQYTGPDTFEYTVSDGTATAVGLVTITVHPPCAPTRCIDNGTVLLAVHPEGHLNASDGTKSKAGPGAVGLHFIPTGNEATAPGCLCEGWGAADAVSEITGFANESADGGARNLTVEDFTATDSSAVSVVTISETLRVTHDYHPSPDTPNLYEVIVTIENISDDDLPDVRYRRVMDWDIEPTAFSEFVTIEGGNAEQLLFSSDNGFESANPLAPRSDLGSIGNFVDAGPADHGALFDFGFGALDAGEETTFKIFYGAAEDEAQAEQAVNAVGAEVYSFGQPSTEDGAALGTPNTFIFAFGNVGGTPIFSPDAVDDTLTTTPGTAKPVNVLANDSDPNDDPLTVTTSAPSAAHGTVSCTALGICTYTPDTGFTGADSFQYSITDGLGGFDTAAVSVTVTDSSTPGPPVAIDDTLVTDEDTAGSVNVLANDTDGDVDTLAVTTFTQGAHGTVSCTTTGSCTYTPAAGFSGTDSFGYTVSDGLLSDTGTVSVTVSPVDDQPTVEAGADRTVLEGTSTAVSGTATDPDGDALTTSWSAAPGPDVDTGAACTFAAPGALSTTVSCTDDGHYTVTLSASDGTGPAVTDTFTLTVTNAAPQVTITTPTPGTVYAIGSPVTVDAAYTDAGTNDTHTCSIDWGDGGITAGTCVGTHTYTGAFGGVITVTVTDDDNGVGGGTVGIVVTEAATSGKRVTGGGTFELGGARNSFGFVAAPSGARFTGQLQLQIPGHRFHGNTVSALTVNGSTATWSGTGRWDGIAGARYTVTITDAGPRRSDRNPPDRISIDVRDAAGALVFSTGGARNLVGGNITVHAK